MEWLAAGLALIGTVITAIVSSQSVKNTNQANEAINERNLDYTASQTQAAWERDDTYYQRSVADAQAAGLSPLAINGAMPNSSPLSSPSPIAMQAPQFDINSLIQSMTTASQISETKRHNIKEEELRADEIVNTSKELKLKAQRLELDNKDVQSQIEYRASLAELEGKRIAETARSNQAKENLEKMSYQSKRYFEEIKHQAGGENVPYKVYNNFEQYLTARDIYLTAFNKFIDDVGLTRQAKADSSQLGFNAGGSYFGTGANAGVNNNESAYDMKDWSQQNEIAWKKFQQQYPVPVYYYEGD